MMDSEARNLPLLTTKLYRPPVTPELEPRTHLIEYLKRNRTRPLTLISAPAGYGKTMLASMWLETSNWPSAWLSLDESDNDLIIFLQYLLAAVRCAFPSIEFKTQNLLQAPSLPQNYMIARYLLNDINQIDEHFTLVVDDVHLIYEQTIYELLREILVHPPRSLHLILVSRHDLDLPIASLRARGEVTEIYAQDLRFTRQETADLMQKMLAHQIDEATAADWTKRTEGWVAALRLAALALRHRGATNDLRVTIQADSRYLQDYLLTEVLAHLPSSKQAWILKTAILDRFCAPLCEAVCRTDNDPADLSGEKFINRLQSENLFLVPLDDRGEWFRFHHLFQQFLKNKLQTESSTEEIAALRIRASNWFAQNHLIDEALQYAIAAGDMQKAVHLLERNRYELMNTEQWHRLESWINLLPADVVAQSPQIICTKAFIAVYRSEDREMISSFQHAEQLLANLAPGTEEHDIVQSELEIISALMDNMAGQPTRSLSRAESSLKHLPRAALHIRSIAIAAKVVNLQMLGDLNRGVTAVRDALAEDSWPDGIQAKTMHYLCIAFFQEGDLGSTLDSARTGLWIAEKLLAPGTISFCRYHLGIAHYLRNEFAQAESHLQALLQDRATSAPHYLMNGSFSLALIYLAQGRTAEALNTIELVEYHCREIDDSFALAFMTAFRVELAIRQGKLLEAHQLNQNVDYDLRPPIWFFYVPQLTPIKILLAEGSVGSLAEARARLDILESEMHRINRKNVLLDVLAISALACAAQGDEPAALEKLHTALELGIRGGNIRSFADLGVPMANLLWQKKEEETDRKVAEYINRILAAFPENVSANKMLKKGPVSTGNISTENLLITPLTWRERQVLKQLPKDISLKEIAYKLSVSPATVYSHTKSIYKKFDVHRREEAVQRARELGLI